tara:strand:+ start:525 stop:791 length:267 start_codon:yes stop_codon:yes gene_type:complete
MPIIPTGNPSALIGYYLGVASLIPLVGILTGLPAIILGGVGISKAKANSSAGGMGHAITAIVLGLIGLLVQVGIFLFFGAVFLSEFSL